VRRRLLTIFTAALVAGVLAGSASPAPRAQRTDVKVWTTKVCTSLKTWQHSLVRRSKAVNATTPKSVGDLHDRFVAFLNAVVGDTDALIAQTKSAGTPSVSQGANIENALLTGFKKLRGYFASDATKAKRLSRTNASQLAAGATALGNLIERQATQITTTFNALDKKYRSSELDAAMKSAAACKGIA